MLRTELNRYGRGFDPWLYVDWLAGRREPFAEPEPRTAEFPPVNVWADADGAVLTTELPGIAPDSIEISVAGKTVTLRGAREAEPEKEGNTYHRQERWHGRFVKTVELPFNIEAGSAQATFRKGVVKVTLPKATAEKPRTIKVKSE